MGAFVFASGVGGGGGINTMKENSPVLLSEYTIIYGIS